MVTSLILPRELAERLPPLADYTPPEDQSGTTDVRIRDHWARMSGHIVPSSGYGPQRGAWLLQVPR